MSQKISLNLKSSKKVKIYGLKLCRISHTSKIKSVGIKLKSVGIKIKSDGIKIKSVSRLKKVLTGHYRKSTSRYRIYIV